MKKALILSGSPRRNGNCAFAEQIFLQGIGKEFIFYHFNVTTLDISPCTDCGFCLKKGYCSFNDDMNIILNKINEADLIIISSPLYFNSVSSQLKKVIDRGQAVWASKQNGNKPLIEQKMRKGYFICTAGSKNAYFTGATKVMDLFFKAINTNFKNSALFDDTDAIPLNKRDDILNIINANFFN